MPIKCLTGYSSEISCIHCGYGELVGYFEPYETDDKARDWYYVKYCPICGREL